MDSLAGIQFGDIYPRYILIGVEDRVGGEPICPNGNGRCIIIQIFQDGAGSFMISHNEEGSILMIQIFRNIQYHFQFFIQFMQLLPFSISHSAFHDNFHVATKLQAV